MGESQSKPQSSTSASAGHRRQRSDESGGRILTNRKCNLAPLFENERILEQILSFFPNHSVRSSVAFLVKLRALSRSFRAFIDGYTRLWKVVGTAIWDFDSPSGGTDALLAQRPPPVRIFESILASRSFSAASRPLLVIAMKARNEELVGCLIKDLGEFVPDQVAVLKFAIDRVSKTRTEWRPSGSPTALAFFNDVISFQFEDEPVNTTVLRPEVPRHYQMRQQQQLVAPPREFVKQSAIDHALFRFENELDDALSRKQFRDFFEAVPSYARAEHDGLGLAPRIPLHLVERLLESGVSTKAVAARSPNRVGMTLLDRVASARTGKNHSGAKLDCLHVVSLLAKYTKATPRAAPRCPVVMALSHSDMDLLKAMADGGYCMNGPDDKNYYNTACSIAGEQLSHEGVLSLVRFLAERGCRGRRDAQGPGVQENARVFGPVIRAVAVCDVELVRKLVEDCDCDVKQLYRFWSATMHPFMKDYTCLRVAACLASEQMCRILVEKGDAPVDAIAVRFANEQTTPEAKAAWRYLKEKLNKKK